MALESILDEETGLPVKNTDLTSKSGGFGQPEGFVTPSESTWADWFSEQYSRLKKGAKSNRIAVKRKLHSTRRSIDDFLEPAAEFANNIVMTSSDSIKHMYAGVKNKVESNKWLWGAYRTGADLFNEGINLIETYANPLFSLANASVNNKLVRRYVALGMLFASSAFAGEVTLAWDPNDPKPEGYRLYARKEGQSYDYAHPTAEVRDQTMVTITGLPEDGSTTYFVVRAFEGALQSADSEEVSYTDPNNPAPTLTAALDDQSGRYASFSGTGSDNQAVTSKTFTLETRNAEGSLISTQDISNLVQYSGTDASFDWTIPETQFAEGYHSLKIEFLDAQGESARAIVDFAAMDAPVINADFAGGGASATITQGSIDLGFPVSGYGLNDVYLDVNGTRFSCTVTDGVAHPNDSAGLYELLKQLGAADWSMHAENAFEAVESGSIKYHASIGEQVDGMENLQQRVETFVARMDNTDDIYIDPDLVHKFQKSLDSSNYTEGSASVKIHLVSGEVGGNLLTVSADKLDWDTPYVSFDVMSSVPLMMKTQLLDIQDSGFMKTFYVDNQWKNVVYPAVLDDSTWMGLEYVKKLFLRIYDPGQDADINIDNIKRFKLTPGVDSYVLNATAATNIALFQDYINAIEGNASLGVDILSEDFYLASYIQSYLSNEDWSDVELVRFAGRSDAPLKLGYAIRDQNGKSNTIYSELGPDWKYFGMNINGVGVEKQIFALKKADPNEVREGHIMNLDDIHLIRPTDYSGTLFMAEDAPYAITIQKN